MTPFPSERCLKHEIKSFSKASKFHPQHYKYYYLKDDFSSIVFSVTRFDYRLQSQGRSGTFRLRVCVSTLIVNLVREQPWKQLPPRNVRREQMLRALSMQSEDGSTCLPGVIKGVGCAEPPLGTAASTCVCKVRGQQGAGTSSENPPSTQRLQETRG